MLYKYFDILPVTGIFFFFSSVNNSISARVVSIVSNLTSREAVISQLYTSIRLVVFSLSALKCLNIVRDNLIWFAKTTYITREPKLSASYNFQMIIFEYDSTVIYYRALLCSNVKTHKYDKCDFFLNQIWIFHIYVYVFSLCILWTFICTVWSYTNMIIWTS